MGKIEQYRKQRENRQKAFEQLVKREEEEKQKIDELKAKFEAMMRESVKTGEDKTAELDKLSEEIEKQEKRYKRKQQERMMLRKVQENEVTAQDVLHEFNSTVREKFKNERLNPVLARLIQAKVDYAKAMFDYQKALKDFDNLKFEYRSELGDSYHYKLQDVGFKFQKEKEKYLLDGRQLKVLERGELPDAYKHNPELLKDFE